MEKGGYGVEGEQINNPVVEQEVVSKRRGFFKAGNNYGRGRPLGSKNQIEKIRSRVLRVVQRRIFREKDLDSVSTTELLKFLASILPKDNGKQVPQQIMYVSNIPREESSPAGSVLEVKTDLLPTTQVVSSEPSEVVVINGASNGEAEAAEGESV